MATTEPLWPDLGRVAANGRPPGTPPRPEPIRAIPLRRWGRWTSVTIVVFLVVALIYSFVRNPNVAWPTIGEFLFKSLTLRGLLLTVELTFVAMAIGAVGGVILAIMRLSENYVLWGVAWVYIWFFRGTPVFVQIVIWGYFGVFYPRLFLGIPFIGIVFGSWETSRVIGLATAAILALGLNEMAYSAELMRAGILSVDKGQAKAGLSLGMSPALAMRRIILPQAMRVIVPTMGNEAIAMLKTTSLIAVLGGYELFGRLQIVYGQTFQIVPLLLVACFWYIVVTTILTVGEGYIEKYFGKGFGEKEAEAAEKRATRRARRAFGAAPGGGSNHV